MPTSRRPLVSSPPVAQSCSDLPPNIPAPPPSTMSSTTTARRSTRLRTPSLRLIENAQSEWDDLCLPTTMVPLKQPCFSAQQASPKRALRTHAATAAATAASNSSDLIMTQTDRPASMRARSDAGAAPAVKRIKATCFDCQRTVTADAATVQCPSCRAIFHTHCQPQLEQQPNYKRSDPTWNPMRICTLGCQISKDMDKLSAWRRSPAQTRSASARSLVRAITLGRTPQRVAGQVDAEPLRVLNPYGCKGFELRRKLVNPQDQERLLHIINQRRIEWEKKVSMLTPSIRSNSRKVFCCTDAQRQLRGGRYAATLRASGTVDKLELRLKSGQDISDYIGRAFLTQDPFVIHTELLCQQVSWHFEDLELHCDRDRRDKTHDRQNVELDGVGDRITSLTLRSPCWLLMRQRSDNTNCFAVWLNPGDVYSLSGEARWDWQHAILLPNPVPTRDEKQKTDECRVSIVFRFIEEYPE